MSSIQLLSRAMICRKKEVSTFEKCILLNKGNSFAILLQHIHVMEKNVGECFLETSHINSHVIEEHMYSGKI